MNPVFGGSENNMGQPAAEALITGPDLETIQTEEIGFLSVAGDTKIQLTTAWPSYTGSTISLLSIIPRKGLVAAAGPDQVIIAETDSVRKAFENVKEDDSNVQPFQPQLVIPMTIPISLLCFTADENYLILTAQTGGGIRVYEVQSLLQGSISNLFDLSTNQESLRSMTPNPIPEKAELCAIVTDKGNLHMANLKGQRISDVLCSQVSCISWSPKGKQLCAGLADGTIRQMTPEAEVKGTIPNPPGLGDCHVSSLLWLENNLFLAIHTTTNVSMAASVYHIITRHTSTAFTFQKIADPIFPFNSDKISHHSILRLRDFPPDIDDLLIVTSTTSTEVGLLSRCKAPLSKEKPITGVFTTTELLDDTKRPTLPIIDSMVESTPIGVSLDLSSKDKVYRPIPSDEEIEESPGPLPALWVLNHEGILCQWWVVYRDSIKKGTTFPGLAATEGTTLRSSTQAAPIISSSFAAPGPTTFSSSATSAPSFGTPSQLGQNSSWAGPADRNIANAADTQPVFGQTGGMRRSPWASTGPATSTFGQSGFASIANSGQGMGFSAAGAPAAPTTGGFSGYTAQSGFGSLAANKTGQNTFGNANKMSVSPFGGIGSSEASVDTAFPPKESMSSGGIFSSTPFKLQSSFKPDPQQSKENDEHPTGSSSSTNFGGTFESALETAINEPRASTPSAKDEDMDTEEPVEQTPQATQPPLFSPERQESTTPTTTPAASRFGLAQTPGRKDLGSANATAKVSSFSDLASEANDGPNYTVTPEAPGVKSEEKDEPFPPETTSKNTNLPGESSSSSATSCVLQKPLDTPMKTSESETATLRSAASTPKASKPICGIRESPVAQASEKSTAKTEEANDPPLPPLHPDFIKSSEAAASSVPLPPDPVQARPTSRAGNGSQPSELILPRIPLSEAYDIPGGPEDTDGGIESGDDNASEGSGIDVAEDLSPSTNGLAPTPGFTPRSSFGGPRGSTATTVGVEHDRSKPLFGEVSRNAPMFPRPHATSSRSPSPIRGAVPRRALKWDATRSFSAPGISTQTLGTKKSQSVMGGSYGGVDRLPAAELSFIQQHRKIKARQEKEETQLLFDEEDDEVQKLLASYVVATLELDEFMAHSNSAPPARDSIPLQVEAVYRDINSMIDTLGLNARSIKAFLKGHMEKRKYGGRRKEDLEIADDWVLCEVPDLGQILDNELYYDLKDGCVQDLDAKLGACHKLARDMQRLRAKREDIKRVLMARLDSEQVEAARNLPLSAEQAAQQNKLRREYAKFSTLLAQVEEALTLLKTRMASASGSSGRGGTTAPTVDAVLRTITKITSIAEKRSGDIDVLETHMQKMRLGSLSREASPMVTPQQARGSIMSPSEWTPSRSFRSSYFGSASLTPMAKATPPKKRLSGFNSEEKLALMEQRARRQAVLEKIRNQVEKQGVHVRNLEDID